ncbi:hypothetical protein GH714_041600 [Hevea brasiliensis]|uniref:NB-ARC domain-containing protein n=1 Tax=Hevea brasiliensis TaxID=3981 RepID=A0A6A6MWF7_HEVBR|nr:hypothetical protein GH714_041600 [Hevea brasiliensis]
MSGVSQKCFVMHDHMHDLARSISGEFGFILEDKNLFDKVPIKTRYLYVKGSSCGYGNFVNEGQLLRTFFSDECFNGSCEVMHSLLPKLKHIRVLSLCKYWETKLPNSISNLKHLRYLNLRRAWIRKLPQSVSSLYNLQTLILRDCKYLIELPTNMAKLINLNFLDIRGTHLQGMPPHMGNLKKLQTLTNFVLRKSIRSGIEELGKLQHIKGELSIENLQNVSPDDDLESIRWVNKENLKKLEFKWSGESKDSEHARIVLDKLRPHEKVENLCMVGYEGTKFPEWVGVPSSSLSNLVCLKLSECYNCSCLPPLGQLASLKDLSITGFTKLVSAGLEFYGSFRSQMKPFKSLTILRFVRMGQWEEWKQEDGAFPLLEELYVEECPKLIKALPTHLPCLKKLEVMGCKKLLVPLLRMPSTILDVMITNGFDDKAMLEKLPSGMHRLEISGSDLVNSLFEGIEEVDSLISALEEIELSLCAIKCFPLEFFPILKRLHINQCSYLKSLSATEEIQGESSSCHNLTELSLFECSNLKALPECICSHPSLVKLEIINCRELELFPKGSLPSKLEYVDISYCEKLKIKVISSKYEGEKETLLLPSAVTCLKIDTLQNLESLNYKGLIHLRRLNIWNCTNLQFMPECMQALLHALVELEIYYCPKLKFKVIASGNGSNYEEEETLLLPTSTLSCLTIQLLQNLESLDYEGLMNLRKLRIWDCPNLQSMPESMQTLLPFLVELKIGNCPKLEPFLKGGLPSRLESLGINGCKGAIVGLMKRDFRALPDNEVESIPEETLLPSSLTTLQIQCFPNLYYLELQHLTSLERLIILDCPNLQCIEGDRLSSLSCYVSDGAF